MIIHLFYPILRHIIKTFKRTSLLTLLLAPWLNSGAEETSRVYPTLRVGYGHQFSGGLDGGGDFSMDRVFLQGGLTFAADRQRTVSFNIAYEQNRYSFAVSNVFGNEGPWGNVHTLRISAPIRYSINDTWSVFGLPTLRFSTERGASLDDGRYGGVLAGFAYRFSNTLTLGPGIGVFSAIEDGTDIFPILLIDWKITPKLSLSTGRGTAATRGPGLSLNWQLSKKRRFFVGVRYEKQRFRLDNDNLVANGGVGEDRAIPVYMGLSYVPWRSAEFNVLTGVELGGQLRIDDMNGARLANDDYDPAPFVGATLRMQF